MGWLYWFDFVVRNGILAAHCLVRDEMVSNKFKGLVMACRYAVVNDSTHTHFCSSLVHFSDFFLSSFFNLEYQLESFLHLCDFFSVSLLLNMNMCVSACVRAISPAVCSMESFFNKCCSIHNIQLVHVEQCEWPVLFCMKHSVASMI